MSDGVYQHGSDPESESTLLGTDLRRDTSSRSSPPLPRAKHVSQDPDGVVDLLFQSVVFRLNEFLSRAKAGKLERALCSYGAMKAQAHLRRDGTRKSNAPTTTHIITDDLDFQDYKNAAAEGIQVVTPEWVVQSIKRGKLQDPENFSADPTMIFSGKVFTTSGLPHYDRQLIANAVRDLGGSYVSQITPEVTHMIALASTGEKYDYIMAHPQLDIKVVLPHWFQACCNLKRLLPETMYLFPNPSMQDPDYTPDTAGAAQGHAPLLFSNSVKSVVSFLQSPSEHKSQFLTGHCIYMEDRLHIVPELRAKMEEKIKEAGGLVVDEYSSDMVDIAICRFRSGAVYTNAYNDGKIIASIDWLFHVLRKGDLPSPKASLLHYPIPPRPIPGMSSFVITISNYTGAVREYLKRMILATGAIYRPTLSNKDAPIPTTHIICGNASGEKFEKGNDWNVKVVNHVWLEECFQTWALQSETKPRYSIFPVHHQLPLVFGAKISPESLDIWTKLDDETSMRSGSRSEEDASKSETVATDGAPVHDLPDRAQVAMTKERRPSQDRETLRAPVALASENRGVQRMEGESSQDRETLAAPATPAKKNRGIQNEERESSQDREVLAAPVNEQDSPTAFDDEHDDVPEPSSPKSIKKRPTPVRKRRTSDTTALSSTTEDVHSAGPSVANREKGSPTPLSSGRESPAAGGLRVLGKRGAAVEASKALQKIVPDMNEFQDELRDEKRASKNKRKKFSAAEEHRDEDESMDMDVDEASTVSSSRKTQSSSPAKRKRPSLVNVEVQGTPARSEDDEAANESETAANDPKSAIKKARRAGKFNKSAAGAVAAGHVEVAGGAPEHGTAAGSQASRVKHVRYISTGLKEQSTKQVKALRALGIVPTTSVEKCTHLVAKNIARTEKFLVALAQGKTIVHEDWFQACIDANAILDESEYRIHDTENEDKFGMDLYKSLDKAREKPVFKDCVFYISPSTVPKLAALKTLTEAGGGKATALLQTGLGFLKEKIEKKKKSSQDMDLDSGAVSGADDSSSGDEDDQREKKNETIAVVSCEEDRDMWQPILATGAKVYSHELIITGILTQTLDLGNVHALH
ncbi:hypothetical protein BGZ72_011038 [Mortierella alpina]|nr:hypothetical protein BGZ72_011038 [Mortierella alpina]